MRASWLARNYAGPVSPATPGVDPASRPGREPPLLPGAVVFVQLADIHFKATATADEALLSEVRRELIRDVTRIAPRLPPVKGVLVCGDIAFSGQRLEYEAARTWLRDVCKAAGCGEEDVRTVPGNHDVDRSGWNHNHTLQQIQHAVRQGTWQGIDAEIHKFTVEDKTAADLLLRPLTNYNDFALAYACEINASNLHWEHIVTLNDGSRLKIRGISSVLVSSPLDNGEDKRLVIGTRQATFTQEDGVQYLLLCHHPPTWLMDGDEVEERIRDRVRVQLFGHKHRQRIDRINDAIRLTAGAVFPEQREPNWVPRYNVLAIAIVGTGAARQMRVTVLPRIWKEEERSFGPDASTEGAHYREWEFPIEGWTSPQAKATSQAATTPLAAEAASPAAGESRPECQRVNTMDPLRRLAYRFLSLSFEKRLLVAQSLGLLDIDDRDVGETERGRRFFARAQERGLLSALWKEVEAQHGSADLVNPFDGSNP